MVSNPNAREVRVGQDLLRNINRCPMIETVRSDLWSRGLSESCRFIVRRISSTNAGLPAHVNRLRCHSQRVLIASGRACSRMSDDADAPVTPKEDAECRRILHSRLVP